VTDQPVLPFVDEHSVVVRASSEHTWAALRRYVDQLASPRHVALFRLLGTEPASGFRIHTETPGREVVLAGKHRFSTYRLVFQVEPAGRTSRLHALTYAAFPGTSGRLYRATLMLSTGHARATNRMLRIVARRAEADQARPDRGRFP
jgi:hypothetical protein